MCYVGRGADGPSLYFLLHFSGSLKLLEKKIKEKDEEGKKGRKLKKSRVRGLGGGHGGINGDGKIIFNELILKKERKKSKLVVSEFHHKRGLRYKIIGRRFGCDNDE